MVGQIWHLGGEGELDMHLSGCVLARALGISHPHAILQCKTEQNQVTAEVPAMKWCKQLLSLSKQWKIV